MTPKPIDNSCPYCQAPMLLARMSCRACGISIDAEFPHQPLSQLPIEHQRFIELFVLAGGSLKEIATQAGVSYPTVRSRLDKVIAELRLQIESTQGKGRRARQTTGKQSVADIIKQI